MSLFYSSCFSSSSYTTLFIIFQLTGFILTTSYAQSSSSSAIQSCLSQCSFRVCDNAADVYISRPGEPVYPNVCTYRNQKIRRVFTNFNKVQYYSTSFPYTRFNKKLLPSTFLIRPAGITLKAGKRFPSYLSGSCIKIPIISYIQSNGKRKNTNLSNQDCVSVIINIPQLEFVLSWNTRDDLDLFLKQPDDTEISFGRRKENDNVLFINDDRRRGCRFSKSKRRSRESIVYKKGIQLKKGIYKLNVEHNGNCSDGPTKWKLRIIRNRKLVKSIQGISNFKQSTLIPTSTIQYIVQ